MLLIIFLNILADSEKFVDQWFVTNPRKTEETFSSIQIGTSRKNILLQIKYNLRQEKNGIFIIN